MSEAMFKCPQCSKEVRREKIIANNYSCVNPHCSLNGRLLVHGEVSTTGNLSKVYGWVLQPGAVLAKKYEIVKMLGKGGYGATYLARDHSMFRQLRAIKEVPRQFCDDTEDEFLTVLNHPAIPRLYERFNHGQFHYSVMEFVEGESLEQIVKRRAGGLDANELMHLARQIVDVLDYIHSRKIVHRDLKPDNILVRKNGAIALIDFGIAKHFRSGIGTRHLARAASYCYSSPEQYQAGKGLTDFKSDIYSLGAILYFMAIGVEPPDALSRDSSRDISPTPRSLNSKVSPLLERVIIKATRMQKNARFKSISEMRQALFGRATSQRRNHCPRCHTPIEPGDKFCSACGSSTQPVDPATVPSLAFRSGEQATSIGQLAALCQRHWSEAVQLLYQGKIEAWLKSLPDGATLARQTVAIRKTNPNKNEGLNHFLVASGFSALPKLGTTQARLSWSGSTSTPGDALILDVTNAGGGCLMGTVVPSASWLSIGQPSFSCLKGNCVRIRIQVDGAAGKKQRNRSATLRIESNGGNVSIPVNCTPADGKRASVKSHRFAGFLAPIVLFIAFMLAIRYLGPTAQPRLASPEVILVSGLFLSLMNMRFGKIGMALGFIMGLCIGAFLDIVAYYLFPVLNSGIIDPAIQYITSSSSAPKNFAGWGMLGAYMGGTFVFFSRKKLRK
ncbi:MAG: serine/threonine protein kinase [Candidatus Zhuqueibacterota bacterium]